MLLGPVCLRYLVLPPTEHLTSTAKWLSVIQEASPAQASSPPHQKLQTSRINLPASSHLKLDSTSSSPFTPISLVQLTDLLVIKFPSAHFHPSDYSSWPSLFEEKELRCQHREYPQATLPLTTFSSTILTTPPPVRRRTHPLTTRQSLLTPSNLAFRAFVRVRCVGEQKFEDSGLICFHVEEADRAGVASIFANNPKLVQMIHGRLGSLVGKPSGYIESLPPPVRRRVAGLKGIQKEHSKLESEFQEEVLQLEKKYFAKFTPLYERRSNIVNGTQEPTDAEVEAAGEQDEDEDEEDEQKESEAADKAKGKSDMPSDVSGIPEFWLSAMKNQVTFAEMITERDEGALRHLTDIRMEYLDVPGFKLIFEFAKNDYFTNKTLVKTYYYQSEMGYGGDFIYDHAEGDKIEWAPNKDLTVRIEAKKQRNKSKSPASV